jgi:hypothetical protein
VINDLAVRGVSGLAPQAVLRSQVRGTVDVGGGLTPDALRRCRSHLYFGKETETSLCVSIMREGRWPMGSPVRAIVCEGAGDDLMACGVGVITV